MGINKKNNPNNVIENAILIFFDWDRAILVAIDIASPPPLANFTWSANWSYFKIFFANKNSSKQLSVVLTPLFKNLLTCGVYLVKIMAIHIYFVSLKSIKVNKGRFTTVGYFYL